MKKAIVFVDEGFIDKLIKFLTYEKIIRFEGM